ncbi:hypothetical protein M3Y98_01082000 [Aphelenchoides besseyi]|nr:hypothetical protein M3Y98_01082000 [Aphelenchoides besseyi]
MWLWLYRLFNGRNIRRVNAGGNDALTQGETFGDTYAGDFTMEDVEIAAHHVEEQQKRRRRRARKDANQIRLNLRKRLTMRGTYLTVFGKPPSAVEVEQDVADNLFAQTVAEGILEIEQDEFQTRARFTHLGYRQYARIWCCNGDYHQRLTDAWENNELGTKRANASSTTATTAQPDAKK